MVIDERTVQVNSFAKGMNSDISLQMIPEGSYIYAENLRVTGLNQTNESSITNGIFEIRPIEGVVSYDILSIDKVLATNSIRGVGAIVYTKNNTWRVSVFDNKIGADLYKDDSINTPLLYEIYNSEEAAQCDKFSTVMHYESDDIIKLYIADGVNPIKLLLIQKDDNGVWKNISTKEVDSYPEVIFIPPKFEGLIPGNLKSGSVQYAYRLYKRYGAGTEMSPTTKLIPIVNRNTNSGYGANKTTNCGVRITIPSELGYQDIYDRILIYRIHYLENGQLPIISLIFDNSRSKLQNFGNDYGLDDYGIAELSQLSVEEFNSISGIHIIPKVIESKNDYLFAAQIKDAASDVFKNVDVTATMQIVEFDGNVDYSNPTDAYYAKSLRRGECYRFGIVLYDKNGNNSGVIHLGDVEVPEGISWKYEDGQIKPIPLGVKFELSGLPEQCVAYEIVRCRRTLEDTRNVSQGILSKPIKRYAYDKSTSTVDDNYPYTPSGFMTMQNIRYTGRYAVGQSRPNGGDHTVHADNFDTGTLLQFVSPEVLYTKDQFLQYTKDQELHVIGDALLYSLQGGVKDDQFYYYRPNDYTTDNIGTRIPLIDYVDSESGDTTKELTITGQSRLIIGYQSGQIGGHNYNIPIFSSDGALSYSDAFYRIDWDNPVYAYYSTLDGMLSYDVLQANRTTKYIKQDSSTYIQLYGKEQLLRYINVQLSNIAIANELQWNDVFEAPKTGNLLTNKYEDFLQNVGTQLYNNVVIGGHYGSTIGTSSDSGSTDDIWVNLGRNRNDDNNDDILFCATGGRCALLNIKQPIPRLVTDLGQDYMYTILCSLRKDVARPYGEDPKLNTYYSYGDYYLSEETSPTVFDGDTYIGTMEYVSMHKMYFPTAWDTIPSHTVIYSVPVETSINLAYTHGAEYTRDYTGSKNSNIQIEPSDVYNVYTQDEPMYQYNAAYSEDTPVRVFAARDDEDSNAQSNIDYRVYYSNLKTNGEYIDNWLKFLPANYIDVDSKYGEITHMRNFHNKLIFWLDRATGVLSVNERVQITDDSNMPLILGTGGVLDRYDYIDNTSGMHKEQYCDAMSEYSLYWFDDAHQELRQYSDGRGIAPLNKQYGTSNLMHQFSDPSVTPWVFYDAKYQEIVLKFNDSKSIVYNESLKAFTAMYTIAFDGSVSFDTGLYLIQSGSKSTISQWNKCIDNVIKDTSGNLMYTVLRYVVNKAPLTTKVFDNQEVQLRWRGEMTDNTSYLHTNHIWAWNTDLNATGDIELLDSTVREGNYRFAVPRENNAEYGGRMRGKYMVCTIKDVSPKTDAGISYISTKYRTSWS